MSKEKLFHVGVKALIENQAGNILLLKAPGWEIAKTKDHWDIPGGRIQERDSAVETLKREIEEETGIRTVENIQYFGAAISNHEIPFEDKILGLVLMVYKVNIPEESEIKLSSEHTEYDWVTPKEAARRLADKYPPEFTGLL